MTACLLLATLPAGAAVVRGHVTSPLGVPLAGARVQLILVSGGTRSVSSSITGIDGAYELRTDLAGRFLVLTSPSILNATSDPQIGVPFYAGRTGLRIEEIALDSVRISAQSSDASRLRATPLQQLAAEVSQVSPAELLPSVDLLPALRPLPGAFVVQYGQAGSPAELYLRGAPPEATQTLLDGLPVENLGGGFNFATLGVTGLASSNAGTAMDLLAVPAPLRGLGAEAGVLAVSSARSATIRPALLYAGDLGSLGTYRNEAVVSAAPPRADLLAAFSRFDTSNEALPYHLATVATNLGYSISAQTALRLTARRDVQATAYTPAHDLFNLPALGKQSAQNLIATLAFDTRTTGNWHNRLGYGLVRKRTEFSLFARPLAGALVTVTGANGSTVTGVAALPALPGREDMVTDRDVFAFQSDRPIRAWLVPVLTLRYQNERGADLVNAVADSLTRTHVAGGLGISGEFRHRLFYSTTGFLDHSPTLRFTGGPSLGLTYAPVRAGRRKFHGSTLHLTLATGTRELTVKEVTTYPRPASPQTRALEASLDQTILPRKLTLRASYFHDQFAHQSELVAFNQVSQTLALRTQGLELAVDYTPSPRFTAASGYTYLASLTEHSAATTGLFTAVTGARPFHRPPNSGFATAAYTGARLSANLKAAFAGRSDDSTQVATLFLPNRNLSPGYASLDAAAAFTLTHRFAVYTTLTNLFDNRHIAPIGYTSTPFVIRTGLRIRLGGE